MMSHCLPIILNYLEVGRYRIAPSTDYRVVHSTMWNEYKTNYLEFISHGDANDILKNSFCKKRFRVPKNTAWI